jgi:4'-phosphopantetheinyl transferase
MEVQFCARAEALRDDLASYATLHVWRTNLAVVQQVGCVAANLRLLSRQEEIRADRFLRQEPRRNYINGRGVLRRLLAIYLRRPPAELEIETTIFGKPFLALPADAWLSFNVAHSGTQLLVAIGYNRSIGVDIEHVRADLEQSELMQNHFAPEERSEIARLPPLHRPAAFFDYWTRKEAYLKATGRGFSTPPDSIVVSASPTAVLEVNGDRSVAARWALRDVPVAPGYAAAVAAQGEISRLRCLDYATLGLANVQMAELGRASPERGMELYKDLDNGVF